MRDGSLRTRGDLDRVSDPVIRFPVMRDFYNLSDLNIGPGTLGFSKRVDGLVGRPVSVVPVFPVTGERMSLVVDGSDLPPYGWDALGEAGSGLQKEGGGEQDRPEG